MNTFGVNFRVRPVDGTFNTMHTDPRVKLVMPFIIKCEYGTKAVQSVIEHFTTQTARQSMALVNPFLLEYHSTGKAKPITDVLNTVTAGGMKNGIITSEQFKHFISYYYGQGNQSSALHEPLGTARAGDVYQLISYKKPQVEDCYCRMIKSKEVHRAMAFADDYKVLGNEKEKVKQLGNAVTPPVKKFIVERNIEALS